MMSNDGDDDPTIRAERTGSEKAEIGAYFLAKAKEAEAQAAQAPNREAKEHFIKIAEGYRNLARPNVTHSGSRPKAATA